MFDAIGVSERTRRPWTVVLSFLGQVALIGLAILAPLAGTNTLPHRVSWITLPEPPRGLRHRAVEAKPARTTSAAPSQITAKGLILPSRIPDKPVILQDPAPLISADNGVGVPGGIGDPTGAGHSIIDSLLPATTPPPVVGVKPAPAPPVPPKRIKRGGLVEEGKLISGPHPLYPPFARQARIQGTVVLEAVISRDGAVLNLKAISGHPLLIPAALAAVQKWVFRPTSLNGEPVEVATQIEVHFTLRE